MYNYISSQPTCSSLEIKEKETAVRGKSGFVVLPLELPD